MLTRLASSLRAWLFGSLRSQVVTGVTLVAAAIMTAFLWQLIQGQRSLLLERQTAVATALATSLAEVAAPALAHGDVAFLKRFVDAQRHIPQLELAAMLDTQRRVLAHLDPTRVGETDGRLPTAAQTVTLAQSALVVNVAAPAFVDGRHVGWVRVDLGRSVLAKGMSKLARGAFAYGLAAVLASALIAALVATRLTRRLALIQDVARAVEAGNLTQRAALQGGDEAARLGRSVDHMLDSLVASREALTDSERRFREALDAASMEAWYWHIASDRTEWGADPHRLLGPRPAAGYADFRQMIVPEDRERFRALGRAALADQAVYQIEFRLRRTDGEIRSLVTSGRVYRDAQGRATAMAGVTQDVTERRQAESELAQSRRLLSDLVEHSAAVIFVKDLQGKYELVNRRWEEVSGLKRDAALGRAGADLFPPEMAESIGRNDAKALAAGAFVEVEETLDDASGRRYFLRQSFHVLDANGQVRGICGMATEITARKRDELRLTASEARLQAILDAVPECVKLIGPDGALQQMNAAGLVMVEAPPDPTPLIGCSVDMLVAPEHRAAFAALTRRVLDGASGEMEFEIIGLSGTRRWMETRAVPLRDDESGTVSMLAVSRDISERKAMQAELLRHRDHLQEMVTERTVELVAARADAERLGQAKSEFLAHMSHEIRTPLNAVLGLTQIGKVESAGSASEATFERIGQAGRHLLAVINDILDFSRLDAGRLDVEQRAFSLTTALATASDIVAGAAQGKGLELAVSRAAELPTWVTGDARRTQQILINLLSNAVKFTPHGKVSMQVSPRGGDEIEFKVVDTGIGMSADEVNRLFEPFEQADSSTTRSFGGSGLGLAISRGLARLMGGDIDVQSVPAVGSTFTLRLPLPTAAPAAATAAPATLPAARTRLAGVRVLAAEDVEVNRMVLEAMLTQEGAEVRFAENGQVALDCLARDGADAFDVVLMDVQMPVMDGYVATREMRKFAPALPVIGLTAHALIEEREKSLAAGMVEHVTKPIDLDALVIAILRQVAGRWSTPI